VDVCIEEFAEVGAYSVRVEREHIFEIILDSGNTEITS